MEVSGGTRSMIRQGAALHRGPWVEAHGRSRYEVGGGPTPKAALFTGLLRPKAPKMPIELNYN